MRIVRGDFILTMIHPRRNVWLKQPECQLGEVSKNFPCYGQCANIGYFIFRLLFDLSAVALDQMSVN